MTTLNVVGGNVVLLAPEQIGDTVDSDQKENDEVSLQINRIVSCIPDVSCSERLGQEHNFRELLRAQVQGFVIDYARQRFLENAMHAIGVLTRTSRRRDPNNAVCSSQEIVEVFKMMCEEFAKTYADIQNRDEQDMSHFAYNEAVDLGVQLFRHRQISMQDMRDGFARVRRRLNDSYKVFVEYDSPGPGSDEPEQHTRPHGRSTVRTLVCQCFNTFANVEEELQRARMHVDFVVGKRCNDGVTLDEVTKELLGAWSNLERARHFYKERDTPNAAIEREIAHVAQLVEENLGIV